MWNPLVRISIITIKIFMRLLRIYEQFRTVFDELLHTYISSHRNETAKAMLNPNFQMYDDYRNLLHFAVTHGNSTIARHLIELGADVDSLGPTNETPLMVAIENMRTNCVQVLLKANANVDAVNAAGNSVLQILYKSYFTNPKVVEAIHDKMKSDTPNINVLIIRLIRAGGSLCHVVYFKDTKILEHALTHFDLNAQGPLSMTALHSAVHLQNLELAKWLVNRGADVNLVDKHNAGPLFHAVILGNKEMVRFLLEQGANPNTEDEMDGSHPLYMAVSYKKETEIVELLIEYGAVIRNASGHLRTIFDQALRHESNEVVNVLVGHLALLERLGTIDVKSVMYCDEQENREAMRKIEKYYDLCQKTLDSSVLGSLKLFDLLVDGGNKTKVLVRNVELENDVIPVICDLFDVNYNQCYFIARKIVDYLGEPDLVKLNRM